MSSSKATDRTPLVADPEQANPSQKSAMSTDNEKGATGPASSSGDGAGGAAAEEEPPIPEQKALIFSIIMIALSCAVAVATNLWISGVISFGINWLVFGVYAWPFHTEKVYDFTGMISFLSVDIFAFLYRNVNYETFDSPRSIIMFICPLIWTLRLGSFLFKRILGEGGKDTRFDSIRNNWPRFFMLWTLQGVWAYFCMLPVLVSEYRANDKIGVSVLDYVGWFLWVLGFLFEVIADHQKSAFKNDSNNRGKFCNVGLWKLSRHPNYFGEITLWWGLTIAASSVARDWDWLMFLSPVWTMILLIGLSGIPASEKAADRKYGNTDGYTQYKATTPVLVPFCYCWK